jgi:uncharacterized protein
MRAAIDTSAMFALASPRDQHHDKAVAIADQFRRGGGQWVGTTLVLAELHALLLYRASAATARRVLDALLRDPIYEWSEAPAALVSAASTRWLAGFPDQKFSVADAVTFEMMREKRIKKAFAFDDHFRIAGFDLLT